MGSWFPERSENRNLMYHKKKMGHYAILVSPLKYFAVFALR